MSATPPKPSLPKLKLKFKAEIKNNYGHLIVLIGIQGSGKSTYAQTFVRENPTYKIMSRDQLKSKTIADMISIIQTELLSGQNIIVDNTSLTAEYQDMYRTLHSSFNTIKFIYIQTTLEDAQIRVLCRAYDKYNDIPRGLEDIKNPVWCKDPHIFPNFILSKAYKELSIPYDAQTVVTPKPQFQQFKQYTGKALFLDIDGTLRKTDHLPEKYPTDPSQIEPFTNLSVMTEVLNGYIKKGYQLIGISNQSGISKKIVTHEIVQKCMEATRQLFKSSELSLNEDNFPIYYCPHQSFPMVCYCRKPYSGLLVYACKKHQINPQLSVFVGDRKTDETCAKRMGIPFINSDKFFKN